MSLWDEMNASADVYDDGCLRIEHDRFYATCSRKPLYELTPKEFLIMSRLARDMGRPVAPAEIWAAAWDDRMPLNPHEIRVYLSTLRRKLKPFGVQVLSKRGIGYILSTIECDCR